jgi:hypothetical protein
MKATVKTIDGVKFFFSEKGEEICKLTFIQTQCLDEGDWVKGSTEPISIPISTGGEMIETFFLVTEF